MQEMPERYVKLIKPERSSEEWQLHVIHDANEKKWLGIPRIKKENLRLLYFYD